MNVDALFDKLAVDLAAQGAVESEQGEGRTLCLDGTPFARLVGERLAVLLPQGSPALGEALALSSSAPAGDGRWIEVDGTDISEWEKLTQQALAGLR